jgi:transcriptional regulator with XRE-family HTH domain
MVRVDRAEARRRRHLAGLTQAELAEIIGVNGSYISLIESGQRPTIGPGVFVRLCDALDVEDRTELILDEQAEVSS